jgi:hypothetical protein
MNEASREALEQLAAVTAFRIAQAPGYLEQRMVLMQAFAHAHRLDPAITNDPDLALLDRLRQEPDRLVQRLREIWMGAQG